MGTGPSTTNVGPDLLQVACSAREGVCGVYRKCPDGKEVQIGKVKGEKLGLVVSHDGLLREVTSGSAAEKAGLKDCIGFSVLNHAEIDQPETVDAELFVLKLRPPAPSHNGYPVWSCGNYHLYSTREGKWMLTDSGEGMEKNSGYAMSSCHCGSAPDELAEWMVFSRSKGIWCVENSFAVWPLKKPIFKVQQLVEFKPSISSPPEEFRPGIITKALGPEAVCEGQPFQYEVQPTASKEGASLLPPVNVYACCIRAHAAYRSVPSTPLVRSGSGLSVRDSPASLALPGTPPQKQQTL